LTKRTRLSADSGTTLAELSVVMILFGILASLILAVTTSALHNQQRTVARSGDMATQKTIFERMTRSIRQANPLLIATPSSVSVQTSNSAGTSIVSTWSLVTVSGRRQLVLDETRAGVVQPRQTLLDHVALAAAGFTYVGETPLTASPAPEDVRSVVIDLSVSGQPTVQGLFDHVELRNHP
jgi:type II secretory pathway pseudopilin PulG